MGNRTKKRAARQKIIVGEVDCFGAGLEQHYEDIMEAMEVAGSAGNGELYFGLMAGLLRMRRLAKVYLANPESVTDSLEART